MSTIILKTLCRIQDRPDLKPRRYRNRVSKRVAAHTGNGAWGEPSEQAGAGIGLRPLGRPARAETQPGFYDPEEERARMNTFLFFFGLVAFLIGGGTWGSTYLHLHRMPPGRRWGGLRRSDAVPIAYKTAEDSSGVDATTRYTRKAVVISLLILVTLSVILVGALSTHIH
ncbi:MAG TPA: hypothetical protein VF043_16605 [Ktedonobacteraceae bacterium]